MNNLTLRFIEKLIEKTKNSELNWVHCTRSTPSIKPPRNTASDVDLTISANYVEPSYIVNKDASYTCKFNNGHIFLLYYASLLGNFSGLELIVQTSDSPNSKTYVSLHEANTTIVSNLKRLYNLIDTSDFGIDAYVRDFLNN